MFDLLASGENGSLGRMEGSIGCGLTMLTLYGPIGHACIHPARMLAEGRENQVRPFTGTAVARSGWRRHTQVVGTARDCIPNRIRHVRIRRPEVGILTSPLVPPHATRIGRIRCSRDGFGHRNSFRKAIGQVFHPPRDIEIEERTQFRCALAPAPAVGEVGILRHHAGIRTETADRVGPGKKPRLIWVHRFGAQGQDSGRCSN